MMETKSTKTRRKKATRATDDVVQATHTMGDDHRISDAHTIGIDDDERRRMIAEAAYYRAQRRGFTNGSPEADWLEAEAEIVALLADAGFRA